MDTRQTLLKVERARVTFGKLVAVRDLSFELKAGDLLGLVGPNGAGKTTLLRAIAALQPLTAGRITVMDGLVKPGAFRVLSQIGFTPDNPAVYEMLTVREFLQFIAKGYDLGPNEVNERIDFWLDQVWLKSKVDQRIKSLSRGMHQRIGIARTMLPNPPVVLLDEPAAGLDPAGRAQFRELLCNLRDQGKALIVSSHILSDLSEYCTHIAIMAAGEIVQFGKVNELTAGDDDRCRYTIGLARPCPHVADACARIEGVGNVEVNRHEVTLEFSRDPADAARLLKLLVTEDVPVASFTLNEPDLEEMYLRTGIRQVD